MTKQKKDEKTMKLRQRTIVLTLMSAGLMLATGCAVENGAVVFNPNRVVQGITDNYQVQKIKQKAEQGDAIAQYILGSYYAQGRGVPLDYRESAKWYRLSAEQGYANAQNRLGVDFSRGRGVQRDYTEAAKWYQRAAEQGNVFAENNLGACYARGRGVAQDSAEALKWYRKAAEQGNLAAQMKLRTYDRTGTFVQSTRPNGSTSQNSPATQATEPAAENPLTVDEIKMLSSTGVKAETLIAQIKETKAKFSQQDIDGAQQANPPVDPEVIKCMKDNIR